MTYNALPGVTCQFSTHAPTISASGGTSPGTCTLYGAAPTSPQLWLQVGATGIFCWCVLQLFTQLFTAVAPQVSSRNKGSIVGKGWLGKERDAP